MFRQVRDGLLDDGDVPPGAGSGQRDCVRQVDDYRGNMVHDGAHWEMAPRRDEITGWGGLVGGSHGVTGSQDHRALKMGQLCRGERDRQRGRQRGSERERDKGSVA